MGCMGDRTKKEYRHKEKVTKNRGMRKLVRLGFFGLHIRIPTNIHLVTIVSK